MLDFHPAANAFPMMDSARFAELLDDIRQHGLLQPITLQDGMVLDGRNRYKACQELGIEPDTRTYSGDPWAYVWSFNGQRRDLVAEQRYLIWKHCYEKSEEFQAELKEIAEEANRKRAGAAREQPRKQDGTMGAKPVVEQNVPQPVDRHAGKAAKATAAKVNPGAVARGDKLAKDRPDLADEVRLGRMKPAEAHRQMKRDRVVKKNSALPDGVFSVLYADPPWMYSDAQAVKGDFGTGTGAAEGHYPAMTLTDLVALPVQRIAADNSALFLWTTCPMLPDALALAKAWGFTYKAQFVWDKVRHNMGHYNSVRHELLLICTRGSCTPEVSKLFDSVQSIERKGHSEKPEEFRKIIETLYPSANKIELFARRRVPGWAAWGNEC